MTQRLRAARKIKEWREKPKLFVWDNFKVTPDKWQEELLDAFPDPEKRLIALQACAGPGKTAGLAWCGWNFLACYGSRGEHPKAAALSITSDNLKDNLWAEMSKWQTRSQFLTSSFTWTHKRIFANDHPNTWFMSARTWSKSANEEEKGRALSGLHSEFLLYLIDESGDIAPAVLKSAKQGLSKRSGFKKILQAGNPTSHAGILYMAAKTESHLWYVVRITGDPDDPKRSPRIDVEHAQEQINTYGRDNPWVMAYILGRFPPTSINALFSPDGVAAAQERFYDKDKYEHIQKRLGIDVARFGDDRTVLFPRQGLVMFAPVQMRGASTTQIAARALLARKRWGQELDFIDDTGGWGAGVIDNLIMAGFPPMAINSSGEAQDPRYYNKRAENYFRFAEWTNRGGALPSTPGLSRELCAVEYTFKDGKLLVIPKEIIKKNLNGVSPDLADSGSLTFSIPDQPAAMKLPEGMTQPVQGTDYNPLDQSL